MTQGKYTKINGLNLYYEIHGKGQPLFLIHGAFGTIDMFGENLPALAGNRQVIGVELQGHGRTADVNRSLSFEQMADDLSSLIQQLGFEKADLMGYSLGGGVALQTAIRHPQWVRKLVVVSAPCKSDGWYAESRAGMKSMNAEVGKSWIGSPMQQAYAAIAPHPEDWPQLVAKMGQLTGYHDYDWSSDVAKLKMPVMIVVGDADGVRTAHAVEFFELLGGGRRDGGWDGSGIPNAQLAVLPGLTHYNIFSSPALAAAVIPFLDAPLSPEKPG